jgi:3-hydroxyacyl-CoA dehydrogenase
MSFRIRKAAVLGAGVMGSGIAAHLANAGIPVLLLDIVPPKAEPTTRPTRRLFATGSRARPSPTCVSRSPRR